MTGYELLVRYDKLGEVEKKSMVTEIKSKIASYVDSKRKSRGYYGSSTPTLDLSVANDPEKLLTYIKNNKPSYRYYGSEVYNILDYIGEDEFKKNSRDMFILIKVDAREGEESCWVTEIGMEEISSLWELLKGDREKFWLFPYPKSHQRRRPKT